MTDHTQQLLNYASENAISLTISEVERIRTDAESAMRSRLENRRPREDQYASEGDGKAARLIGTTLLWAKAAVPLIALLAALASSVRTLQTASEIYTASGSHPVGVLVAAIAFTISVEGALFALALAQEGQRMKHRAEKRPREVWSVVGMWHSIQVRIGIREPKRHDELPQRDNLGLVIFIAFTFAVMANAYMGFRPLLDQVEAASLQSFVAGLWTADGALQLTFLVDLFAVMFPPFMALTAGHLTARFAAEIAEAASGGRVAYERDLAKWRTDFAQPLATAEGAEFFQEQLENRLLAKAARHRDKYGSSQEQPPAPLPGTADPEPVPVSANGSSGSSHTDTSEGM